MRRFGLVTLLLAFALWFAANVMAFWTLLSRQWMWLRLPARRGRHTALRGIVARKG